MDPITPLTTESDASYGFTLIMNNLGYLRQQAEANNKRPFPATEDEVKALVKLAERDRPLVVKVTTEEVVAQLVGQMEQLNKQLVATLVELGKTFLESRNRLVDLVDDRTNYLRDELALGVKDVKAATDDMKAGAARIPSKMTVDFKQGWRWVAGLVLGPVVLLLLAMTLMGQFSKVDKEAYEQAKATNVQVVKEGGYYKKQIEKYKAKNPETTAFPAYEVAQ